MSDTLTRGKIETDVTQSTVDEDFSGWWCIKVIAEECICGEFVSEYMTVMHLIIVWPTLDDGNLLQLAANMQKQERDPKIVEYKNEYGKCISYYEMKNNPNIIPHQIRR